ncbi:PLP-dependent lyase/thiolase, partial [Candidatus Roizmanbacteria bacterium]|nr:PLP-dependent lyase/thiolase [Candidatus Roizmanbacteria bacterium]
VKDRAVVSQIGNLQRLGVKKAVISSSGNAAISAAYYCKRADVDLDIFVSPNILKQKLDKLKEEKSQIYITSRPIKEAHEFSLKTGAFNLRQSKDKFALSGYGKISEELITQQPEIDAIFIPVSSGSILVGIGRGFKKLGKIPALHAIQTEAINPIASQFDHDFTPISKSLADAIVARVTPLENEIIEFIRLTEGGGWVVSDSEILKAHDYLTNHNFTSSYEGGAMLAGFWKAERKGIKYKNPVCLLTGTFYA